MSQFRTTVKDDPTTTVVYGLDHVFGWFYQEFNAEDECVSDLDTLMSGLSRGRLVDLLVKTNAPSEHITRIALDLDPEG